MKSHVASATNAVIICIAVFSFYIIIENCVLDLSSFQLNEYNKMTLKVSQYETHTSIKMHVTCIYKQNKCVKNW
jgi:ribosomal protein L23